MTSGLTGVGHVPSEPIGAVDAGHRLARGEIHNDPATAERVDARLRAEQAPAESPGALEIEVFSASEHEARHVFRLAVLVGVNPESARAALVVDLHLEAESGTFVAVQFS